MMVSKERFLTTIKRGQADRLPVTTHHLMPSFLNNQMNGISGQEFFEAFGLDAITWIMASKNNQERGEFFDPTHTQLGFLESHRIVSECWKFQIEQLPNQLYKTEKFSILTPEKNLSMILQSNEHTTWIAEHLIREKNDIEIIAKYMTYPLCDVTKINACADAYGDRGLVRGHISCFEGFGQPGCWQDLACLYGIENLILASFEDPNWVHTALKVLMDRKKVYIESLDGARYDLLELGGGDASTTVISPDIFNQFIAPYDSILIESAHNAGQRIVYHTCGGMMPILEDIAAMKPDAMETFTPRAMGGDTLLSEAKKRIGDKVCMIGGFDQFHFFMNCSPEETRQEVRRCFKEAGQGGGYILCPSDHFFTAKPELIQAFADEARNCIY